MDTEIFTKLGLNNTEIKVYFALLKLDTSSVGPIVKESMIPDSKIYYILDTLKEKGLVSYVIKNKIKYYQASDPENLIKITKNKEEELKSIEKKLLEKIIPEIKKRKKLNEDRQEAYIYESFKGVKSAFSYMLEYLKKGEEYYVFANDDFLLEDKNIINFFYQHHKKRMQKNIKVKLLYPSKIKEILKKHYEYKFQKHKEYKYIDQKLPLGTYVFRDHVMTVMWSDNPTAFVIKSKKNYQYYKDFFEDVWKRT